LRAILAGGIVSLSPVLSACGGAGNAASPSSSTNRAVSQAESTCPTDALALPGEAVARAADQARIEAPALYGQDTTALRVTAAYRADTGFGRSGQVRHECGAAATKRTVVVELLFPKMLPGASLSQGTVFVSRFGTGYRVWEVAH
jgi:hypothetical protein